MPLPLPEGLPPEHAAALQQLVGEPAAQADAASVFGVIGEATFALLGPGLLTINAWRPQQSQVVRLWSSDPASYPVGGSKHKGDTPWARQVLQRAEVFVGEGDQALAEVFDDISKIRGLGLRAVVNVPICHEGRCVGTFNYLRAQEAWASEEVMALRRLAGIAGLVFSAGQMQQG
ncbi:GAF domain-containing protein [Cupriavidus sp. AU9028]|uniref:GAF domain-containing protein n=1 Tax=Cupriavidus sp. AU9028 TaxID=2871157 RepID=UPI001C9468F7|nr:GAF domain-containing protein [Cupriavidus sp. AU9028]